jgi:hypothetical protein
VEHRITVAEVRVFPTRKNERAASSEKRQRALGQWSRAPSAVPAGGVKAKALRGVHVGEALRIAFALSRDAASTLEGLPSLPERRAYGPRGDEPLSPTVLAEVAALYAEARQTGSPAPARATWEALRSRGHPATRSTVRTYVRQARQRGFLSEEHALTPRGQRALTANEENEQSTDRS